MALVSDWAQRTPQVRRRPNSFGNLTIFAAMRRASSLLSNLAAESPRSGSGSSKARRCSQWLT